MMIFKEACAIVDGLRPSGRINVDKLVEVARTLRQALAEAEAECESAAELNRTLIATQGRLLAERDAAHSALAEARGLAKRNWELARRNWETAQLFEKERDAAEARGAQQMRERATQAALDDPKGLDLAFTIRSIPLKESQGGA